MVHVGVLQINLDITIQTRLAWVGYFSLLVQHDMVLTNY